MQVHVKIVHRNVSMYDIYIPRLTHTAKNNETASSKGMKCWNRLLALHKGYLHECMCLKLLRFAN